MRMGALPLAGYLLCGSLPTFASPVPDAPTVIPDMWHVDSAITADGNIVPCSGRFCSAYWRSSKGWQLSVSRQNKVDGLDAMQGLGFGPPAGRNCSGEVRKLETDADIVDAADKFLRQKLKECEVEDEGVPDRRTLHAIVRSDIWTGRGY